jgi:hypothetical protein
VDRVLIPKELFVANSHNFMHIFGSSKFDLLILNELSCESLAKCANFFYLIIFAVSRREFSRNPMG